MYGQPQAQVRVAHTLSSLEALITPHSMASPVSRSSRPPQLGPHRHCRRALRRKRPVPRPRPAATPMPPTGSRSRVTRNTPRASRYRSCRVVARLTSSRSYYQQLMACVVGPTFYLAALTPQHSYYAQQGGQQPGQPAPPGQPAAPQPPPPSASAPPPPPPGADTRREGKGCVGRLRRDARPADPTYRAFGAVPPPPGL
jgi:hypothetical protein